MYQPINQSMQSINLSVGDVEHKVRPYTNLGHLKRLGHGKFSK